MNKLITGIMAGVAFGVVDVALMIPIAMADKPRAMVASFVNRFAIGFLAVNLSVISAPWLRGVAVGLILSLPDAIITKIYGPILGIGVAGGLIVALAAGR
jgi:hypothetical protein